MKKKEIIILSSVLVVLLMISATLAILVGGLRDKVAKEQEEQVETFAAWTEHDALSQVPAFIVKNARIGKAFDIGSGNYMIDVEGTNFAEYQDYLTLLEEQGYKKVVDNGKNGLAKSIYTTTYTKDELTVSVTHVPTTEKTYIMAGEKQVLSPNLFYDESYVKDNIAGASTKLYLLEMNEQANCLVIQMKNGHFIVSDSGARLDVPYLLDFLEEKAPEGQKPIVEALFFTHPHGDHASIMDYLVVKPEEAKRVIVEGVYYSTPGKEAIDLDSTNRVTVQNIKVATGLFKTSTGEKTQLYRPQAGQKYYFSDIQIDIVMAQELIFPEQYFTDLNESSTVSMFHIDGQKILLPGDSGAGLLRAIMRSYSEAKEYFEMEVMVTYHHSFDTWSKFTDFCKADTLLVTRSEIYEGPINQYLVDSVKESYAYGEGTVELTFPYKLGEAKILPKFERIYTNADVYPAVDATPVN